MYLTRPIYPHCKGNLVEIKGKRYRADFWYGSNVYEFICVDEELGEYHQKRVAEQVVSDAIKSGFVKIL
jgi:hypothetical protein